MSVEKQDSLQPAIAAIRDNVFLPFGSLSGRSTKFHPFREKEIWKIKNIFFCLAALLKSLFVFRHLEAACVFSLRLGKRCTCPRECHHFLTLDSRCMCIEVRSFQFFYWVRTPILKLFLNAQVHVTALIIYMKKFLKLIGWEQCRF